MRSRRRRNKATWLPISPTYWGEGQVGTTFYETTTTFPVDVTNGDTVLTYYPLVLDETTEPDSGAEGTSMRDVVEGQEYILDRLVGTCWVKSDARDTARGVRIIACFAVAVLPVDDLAENTPALDPVDFNPLLATNAMSPWLIRKCWILSTNADPGFSYPTSSGFSFSPSQNLDTNGVKRRIRREQRLFAICAAGMLSHTTDVETTITTFGSDLRALGHMVRAKNTSTFK